MIMIKAHLLMMIMVWLAELLNKYYASVFTTEDQGSLPKIKQEGWLSPTERASAG